MQAEKTASKGDLKNAKKQARVSSICTDAGIVSAVVISVVVVIVGAHVALAYGIVIFNRNHFSRNPDS